MKKAVFLSIVLSLVTIFTSGFRPISASDLGESELVAIGGFDTVAYFTENAAVKGTPLFSVDWRGAKWYFSKRSHMESFRADPEKYAPRYGGYCAFCLMESEKVQTNGNPEYFIVWENKLYLLQSEEVRDKWSKDIAHYAKRADKIYTDMFKAYMEQTGASLTKRVP